MKKAFIVILSLLTVGIIIFVFYNVKAGGFVIGGTCGFCGPAPATHTAEYACIGQRIEVPPPQGCMDCGNTVVCRGIPLPPKSCFTYWGSEKIRLPSCDGPQSWNKSAMESLCASIKDSSTRNQCDEYIQELQGIGVSQTLPSSSPQATGTSNWSTFEASTKDFTFEYPPEVNCASYDPTGKPVYKSCKVGIRDITSSTVVVDPFRLYFAQDKKTPNFVSLEESAKRMSGGTYTITPVIMNGMSGILSTSSTDPEGSSDYLFDGGNFIITISYQGSSFNQYFEQKLSNYDDFRKQEITIMQKIISTFRLK